MVIEFPQGPRTIKNGLPPCIIAEIGTAHDGHFSKAKELIHAAKEAGADCVKFQMVYADEIIHPLCGSIILHNKEVSLYERFKQLEQKPEFYLHLKEEAENKGLLFLCTPFGEKSAFQLHAIGVKAVKIASPELNHYPLLRQCKDLPLILSTGVSLLGDIEKALAVTGKNCALLHCVTAYPAPEQEYNLKLIPLLSSLFGVPVGVSDHSLDPVLIPVISAALGAALIEKHITLNKQNKGLDDPIALTPNQLKHMCKEVRNIAAKPAGLQESYIPYIRERFGNELVESILGHGEKIQAPSEIPYYATTNRSIMAIQDIAPEKQLNRQNIALLRSETGLSPGLPPEWFDHLIGKRVTTAVHNGEGLKWDHLIKS